MMPSTSAQVQDLSVSFKSKHHIKKGTNSSKTTSSRNNVRRLDSVIGDSGAVNNRTLTSDPFSECNVILFPLVTFLFICSMILFVLCRYKICGKVEQKEETDDWLTDFISWSSAKIKTVIPTYYRWKYIYDLQSAFFIENTFSPSLINVNSFNVMDIKTWARYSFKRPVRTITILTLKIFSDPTYVT